MNDTLTDTLTDERPETTPDPVETDTPDTGEGVPDRDASARRRNPSATSNGTTKRDRKPRKSGGNKSLQRDLEQLLGAVGAAVSMLEPFDGAVVLANAGSVARRLDDLAKENPAIHRTLSLLTSGSGGTMGVVFALLPVVLPILHHHNLIPSSPVVDSLVDGMTPDEAKQAASAAKLLDELTAAAAAAGSAPPPGTTPGPGTVTGSA